MKIIVTCENSKKRSQHMSGEMAFKVHGMFTCKPDFLTNKKVKYFYLINCTDNNQNIVEHNFMANVCKHLGILKC